MISPLAQYAHAPILVLVACFLMLQPLSTDLGTAVGASLNGSLYPLALIVCLFGAGVFASVRLVGIGAQRVAA